MTTLSRKLASVTQRSAWLLRVAHDRLLQLNPPLDRGDREVAAVLLIETANTWATFMRAYFLASAGGAYLADGSRVVGANGPQSTEAALDWVVPFFRPSAVKGGGGWTSRDEPNWLDPTITQRALSGLGLSNATDFGRAMSAGSGSYERLTTCRNFAAHRNRLTAERIRRLVRSSGVVRTADPSELPLYPGVGRPQPLVADWVDEMIAMIELAPS